MSHYPPLSKRVMVDLSYIQFAEASQVQILELSCHRLVNRRQLGLILGAPNWGLKKKKSVAAPTAEKLVFFQWSLLTLRNIGPRQIMA